MKFSILIQLLLPALSIAAYSDGTICNDASLTDATCTSKFTTCMQKSSECAKGSSVPACRQGCRINCDDCTTKATPATAQAAYNTCMANAKTCADRSACIAAYNGVVQQCIDLANQANAVVDRSYKAANCGSLMPPDNSSTKIDCNGQCVDRAVDKNNCGVCGHKCASGLVCENASCKDPKETLEHAYSINYLSVAFQRRETYSGYGSTGPGPGLSCDPKSSTTMNFIVPAVSTCCLQLYKDLGSTLPNGPVHCGNWTATPADGTQYCVVTGC